MVYTSTDNNYGTAKLIVGTTGKANYLTIASAITAASSGDTIFILPGTYTENLTLKAGVSITAFTGDSGTPNVTIIGKATASGDGTYAINNIRLTTNSDFFLVVSGSVATIVKLDGCYLNCLNATGISYTSSSASSEINVRRCTGDIITTGIALYTSSSPGLIRFEYCYFLNSALSITASSNSSGRSSHYYCTYNSVFSTSSTGTIFFFHCTQNNGQSINTAFLTTAGSGQSFIFGGLFTSGTASCFSIGTGTILACYNVIVYSENTNAITGAGTLQYSGLSFSGTSNTMNTTTKTANIHRPGITRSSHQPAFLAQLSGNLTSVTGDNTVYTVVFGSEVADQNNDFSSTTFTAPYTGLYQLSFKITYYNLGSGHTAAMTQIVTSNIDYNSSFNPYGNRALVGSFLSSDKLSILADMDLADIASVRSTAYNSTKTVNLEVGTFFSGSLIC